MAEPLLTPRKAELVRLAGGLFAARGFHGTSMRDIGDAVGMRRGSLYSHFESKEEIVECLLRPALLHLDTVLRDAAEGDGNGAERLERGVGAAVSCCIENRDAFAYGILNFPLGGFHHLKGRTHNHRHTLCT